MANKPEDYKYIEAWGVYMRSFNHYIRGEQAIAASLNAPLNAIYRDSEGKWLTFDEITNVQTKAAVDNIWRHVVNNTIELKKTKLENHGYVIKQDGEKFTLREVDDENGLCITGDDPCDVIEEAYHAVFEHDPEN